MKLKRLFAMTLVAAISLTACSSNKPGGGAAAPQGSSPAAAAEAPAAGSPAEPAAPANDGKVYNLKFAHVVRPTTPKGMGAEEFKRLAEEKSGGRLEIDIYPDSQMGTDQEITEQMLLDTVHINAPVASVLTSVISEYELFDLPYLFVSEEAAYEALHGELGEKFGELLDEKGFVNLGFWSGGFKQLTNSVRPVESVADLNGLKIRVSQSPLLVSQFQALNAGGISVPFAELYTALQTKTVEGQENPLSNIASRKFYEVQNYMTMSDHGLMVYSFIISKSMFESLPADLQQVVREAAEEATAYQWKVNKDKDQEYYEEIENAGTQISVFSDAAKEEFRAATQGSYDDFAKTKNGQELLDIAAKYNK